MQLKLLLLLILGNVLDIFLFCACMKCRKTDFRKVSKSLYTLAPSLRAWRAGVKRRWPELPIPSTEPQPVTWGCSPILSKALFGAVLLKRYIFSCGALAWAHIPTYAWGGHCLAKAGDAESEAAKEHEKRVKCPRLTLLAWRQNCKINLPKVRSEEITRFLHLGSVREPRGFASLPPRSSSLCCSL